MFAPRFYPAREITPGLWVGSFADATDAKAAKRRKFTLVINCTKDIPAELPVPTYRVPVDDWPGEAATLLKHLPDALTAIDAELSRGGTVLVHCHAGMQRSAAVVAAYLMWKHGLKAPAAMARVQSAKPETFTPVPTFAAALKKWETRM